jgi:hypothetical protein
MLGWIPPAIGFGVALLTAAFERRRDEKQSSRKSIKRCTSTAGTTLRR